MHKNKTINVKFFYILISLISLVIAVAGSYSVSMNTKEKYLDEKKDGVIRSYYTIYNQYKNLADIIFKTKINTDEVLTIFKDAKNIDRKDVIRDKLYKKLLPVYKLLKDQNIRQLHFHLPNNESFLRFHRPKKFGDNLTNIRSTVAYVNKNKKSVDSFEEGRIYNGYRFVYPLFYNYEHIGSVEVSFNALAFFEEFCKTYERSSDFFILKDVVDYKTFKSEKLNYVDSPLKDFYIDKVIREKMNQNISCIELDKISDEQKNIVNEQILQNKTYSFYNDKLDKLITVIPIKNELTNKVVGGFITAEKSFALKNITREFYINTAFFTLIILLISYLFYRKNFYEDELNKKAVNKTHFFKNTKRLSLFNIVGVVSVIGMLVSVSIYTIYSYKIKKDELYSENLKEAKGKISQLVTMLPHFIESYETYEYENLIKAMMDKNSVAILVKNYVFGEVIDDVYLSGKIRVSRNEIEDYSVENESHQHILKTSYHKETTTGYSHSGKKQYDLEVYITDEHIKKELKNFLFSKIVESFAFLIVLLNIILGILYFYILQPIQRMIRYISDTDKNKLPKHKIPAMASVELEYLGTTINNMVVQTAMYQNKLEDASKNLEEQKEKYQNLLYSSYDAVFILDIDGKVVEYSHLAISLYGYSEEEMNTLDVYDMDKNLTIEEFKSISDVLEGENILLEREHTKKSGEVFISSVSATKIKVRGTTYIKASVRDITEQKKTEQELIDAKENADKANKSKSEFLANMSHEIRTPLNGIIGLTDIVLNSQLNAQQKDYLNKAKQSSKSLLNIINDILDYSKIEAGKLDIVKERFVLNELLENIYNLFEYEASQKDLEFNFNIDKKIDRVLIGDNLRISQVLNNFIGNALKFTNKGFVKLDVKLLNKTDKTMKIEFSVEDSGIGIAKNNQEKLFKAFNQEDNSTTKEYGGTGLGLVISKQLINMMGGNIEFESEKDKGSTFKFILELEYTDEMASANDQLRSDDKQSIKLKDSKKALVVEDNETNQIVAKSVLENIGFEVELADDGLDGLKKVKDNKYDIVFMDLQMPNMDGFETTKKIREFDTKTPVVALSAAVMEKDKELTKEAGMDDHLAKPIVIVELEKLVQRYFKIEQILKVEDESVIDLPQIDGVDLRTVVEIVNGDLESLVSMYEKFARDYSDIEKIQNLSFDSDEYKSYIHKLKGVSGNLKIEKVFELSSKINNENQFELTGELIETTRKICQNIRSELVQTLKHNYEGQELSDKELEIMIKDILNDLEEYLFIKSSRVSKLLGSLKTKLDKDTINSLQKGFDDIDNKRLIKELNEVLEVIK